MTNEVNALVAAILAAIDAAKASLSVRIDATDARVSATETALVGRVSTIETDLVGLDARLDVLELPDPAPQPTPVPPPPPVLTYVSEFDRVWSLNKSALDSTVTASKGTGLYTFQYANEAIISMWEGTRDPKYLEQALTWAEKMLAAATLQDSNGYLYWRGTWASPYGLSEPNAFLLEELQGSTALARLAYVVLSDSTLSLYHPRAAKVRDFVAKHVLDKWKFRGQETWCRNHLAQTTLMTHDKPALLGTIAVWMAALDAKYRPLADDMVAGHLAKLKPFNGGLAWDIGLDNQGAKALDTGHANRWPALFEAARRTGYDVSAAIKGVGDLLVSLRTDDNGAIAFQNYLDGTNLVTSVCTLPYRCGLIYSGWVMLAAKHPGVLAVASEMLDAIMAGKRNASLDISATFWGRLALAGHLTLAQSGR